jgi:hypothetical protein
VRPFERTKDALTRLKRRIQQKCTAVLRPELHENKEIEHFRDSKKNGNALAGCCKTLWLLG